MTPVWTAALAAALCAWTPAAQAQVSDNILRIGFISDLSGIYADYDGPAGAEAIRMAVADVGGSVAGAKVEVLVADHQNKPDIAASKAREWFDTDKVDMLVGGVNSAAALAMARVAAEKKKPYFVVGS
ncbi:MAG TPA: ABC transporter substrate-binding protein, partial [Ramlibacter sp.]|nr:ABC transporter substrate-binding protein [Ramlibacter sp.]